MENINNDEINLFELIAKSYKFVVQKKWLILLSCIIFIVFGLFKYDKNVTTYSPSFKKEITGYYSTIPTKIVSSLIDNLVLELNQVQSETNMMVELSKKLNLPVETLKTIQSIEVIETTEDNLGKIIKLNITTNNKDKFPEISKGIEYFISSNPFVKSKHQDFIDNQYKLLALVKEDVVWDVNSKSQANYDAALLAIKKQQIKNEIDNRKIVFQFIELNSPILTINNIPSKPFTLIKYGIVGIVLGMIIGMIPLFLQSVKKYL